MEMMKIMTFLKLFLPDTRSLTSAERYSYMGFPTQCFQCGKPLQARSMRLGSRNSIRVFCPNMGRDDSLLHSWFEWTHMGGDV